MSGDFSKHVFRKTNRQNKNAEIDLRSPLSSGSWFSGPRTHPKGLFLIMHPKHKPNIWFGFGGRDGVESVPRIFKAYQGVHTSSEGKRRASIKEFTLVAKN